MFRGIPETVRTDQNDEHNSNVNKQKQETWQETEKLLAEKIAEVCEISVAHATEKLERVHRSAPNPRYKGKAPQPIFAAVYDWKFSEMCKETFKDKNISKTSQYYCEQKYGPMTQQRRNLAMQERKTLKEKKEILSAFVAFPALD